MAHTPPGRTRERVRRFVRERLLAGDPPTVREVQEAFGFRAVESARAHLEALVAEGFLVKAPGRARGYRLQDDRLQDDRLRDEDGADDGVRARGAARGGFGGGHGGGFGSALGDWPSPFPPPVAVPLLGRVQAGALTLAVEDAEDVLAVQSRAPAGDLFALRVRGDSMRGAGILEGDVVVVRRQETAEDGQIVVALVGDEATVKRLRKVRAAGGGTRGGADGGTSGETCGGTPGGGAPRVELHPENPDFPVIAPPPGDVRILGRVVEVRRTLDDRGGSGGAGAAHRGGGARRGHGTVSGDPGP